ncbi:MAG: BatD family protein [Lamprobacter sp.]|uniref:BatD family protein n=1 Tax=Lamprobacter sp. TaxID=3100796 RepID=UPI002B261846|nr:BatD family protein [Lamprobacter sp.]MEA3641620.1 BatD family protein [Lamprobacter sp.]
MSPLSKPLSSTLLSLLRWLLVVSLLIPSLGLAAEARAVLNQSQVYEGDPVLLTIEVAERTFGQEPDLSVLDDDFDVGGVSTSQQMQFINGQRSDKTSWQVALRPKRLGRLSIPAIQVGSATTAPLSLLVEAVPEGGLGAPGDLVWLEVEVGADPRGAADGGLEQGTAPGPDQDADSASEKLVVQQQVPLVVRAYSARPLLDYAIEMPPIEGAVLNQIGRDQGSLTMRAGQQYRVIERRYTLNPERSGALRIPPILFEAELQGNASRRPGSLAMPGMPDLFDDPRLERMLGGLNLGSPGSLFERGELARAQSQALTLEVAPSGEGFSGEHWLPATALEVTDSWNPADGGEVPRLVVGEPATRTLTLTARGLAGNQIPELEVPAPPGFRAYPGRTESETRSDGENLIGISRQQLTLIPTQGGAVELPSIEVPWWDIQADQERRARVPARVLDVAGAVAAATPKASALTAAEADAARQTRPTGASGAAAGLADSVEVIEASEGSAAVAGWKRGLGSLVSLIATLLLSAGGIVFLWRRQRFSLRRAPTGESQGPQQSQVEDKPAVQARRARDALRGACERDDPQAAATALLAWAGSLWSEDPPRGLGALADRAERGSAEIRALERALYGSVKGQPIWRGEALWAAVKRGLAGPAEPARTQADQLAPLYPGQP